MSAWYQSSRGKATPNEPESIRDAKRWLQRSRIDGRTYSPTADQPALTSTFDMRLARRSSPSFDKLWRDVEWMLDTRDEMPLIDRE